MRTRSPDEPAPRVPTWMTLLVLVAMSPSRRILAASIVTSPPSPDSVMDSIRDVSMKNSPARMALIEQLMDILQKDAPAVWMVHPVDFGLYHVWLTNTKPHKMSSNTTKFLRVAPKQRVAAQSSWNQPIVWPVVLLVLLLCAGAVPAALQIYRQEKGR